LMLFSQMASGNALDVLVQAPMYETKQFGNMPLLDVSSSHNPETKAHAVFIVNRSQTESVTVDLHWQDLKPKSIKSVQQVAGTDPKAANTYENPNQIIAVAVKAPALKDGTATLTLPPLSFTAVEVAL
jgi:alpha-L-arabinofuranosidase